MQNPSAPTLACPRCGLAVFRVHRTLLDRLSSLLVPQLRLRCGASACGWQGLVPCSTPGAAPFMPQRTYRPQTVLTASRGSVAGPGQPGR